jgi:hypothetical protein
MGARRAPVGKSFVALALAGVALAVVSPDAVAGGWLWPVHGPVIARFRYGPDPFARGQRRGIDIAATRGTPVVSACSGRVRFAGSVGASGRTVSVACGAFVASYLHLDCIATRRGARIDAGDEIGTVGTTGRRRESRPHLAFGARRIDRRWGYVDPLRLLGGEQDPPPDSAPAVFRRRRPQLPVLAAPRRAPQPDAAPQPAPGRAPEPGVAGTHPATGAPARRAGVARAGPPAPHLPLGALWLPVGAALALAAIAAPLGAIRIRRRRRGSSAPWATRPARRTL